MDLNGKHLKDTLDSLNMNLNGRHLKDTLETLQKNHDDWTTLSPSLLWSSLLQLSPIIHSGTWSMVIKKSSLTGLNIRRYLHTANDDANTTTAYQTTSKLATALMQYQNENGLISSHQPKSKSKYFGNNLDFLYDEPSNKETNKKNNSSANQVFDDMEAEMKAASHKKQNKTTIVIDDDSENDEDDDDLEFEELESTSSSSSTRRPAKRKAPTGNSSEDEDADEDSDKDSDEESDQKVQRSKKRIKLSRKSKKKVKYQESSEDEDEDEDEEDRQLDQDSKKKDSDSDSDFEELPKQRRRRRRKAAPVEISSSDEEDNQDDDQVEGLSKHQRDKAAREKRMKNERRNQSTMRTRMRGQEKYADNLCVYCGDYIEEKYRDPTNDGDTYCGKYSSEGERASRNGSTVVDISMTLSSFKPISLPSRRFPLF